ncbi:MAG: CBS domain-containing protein [Pseudomonadota bacterium]
MTADNPVVRDFVIPLERYPHLQETKTIHDAVEIILSFNCGGNERLRYSELFVLNEQNQLVGRMSLRDILKGLDRRLVEVPAVKEFEGKGAEYPNLAFLWEESFFVECSRKKDAPLKGFMSPVERMVKADDSLVKALSVILHGVDQVLPVIDGDEVIGVIRLEEIFKAVCRYCKL